MLRPAGGETRRGDSISIIIITPVFGPAQKKINVC